VTLSCSSGNLPPQTTCVFDPPVVTPGAKGATSTLTISTVSSTTSSVAQARPRALTTLGSGVGIFPSSLTFGAQTLSTTSPAQLVSVTNTGGDPLNITGISTSGDFASVSNCGTSVASGASCGVSVTFTPTAIGARTGTLTFTEDAAGSPHVITLNGTGQAAPATTGGTPAGSYTLTISGTAGTSVAHLANVTVTVK
jgi:hypothetical protein